MSIRGVKPFCQGFRLLFLRFLLRGICLRRWRGCLYIPPFPRICLYYGVDGVESVVVGRYFDGFAWFITGSAEGFQILLVDACMD